MVFDQSSRKEDSLPADEVKIYYCSRTHSQLTQFVQELRRVDIAATSGIANEDTSAANSEDKIFIKHLPLGSRRNLCINPHVSSLGSLPAINERCLELQQPDTPKDHKCQFIPNQQNEMLVDNLRDHTMAKIRDIEDLGSLGGKIGICPYYASRAIIRPSEVGLLGITG